MTRSVVHFILAAVVLMQWGCSHYDELPAGTSLEINATAVVEREDVQTAPLEVVEQEVDYLVGRGDMLSVNVAGKEELSVGGSRVDAGGYIRLPVLGSIHVAGSSLRELQASLAREYAGLLRAPWVVVEVVEYRSHPLYLLGQFSTPGTYYLDRPFNLLQGISLGGGTTATADLRGARLMRNGRTQPIDIYRLLQQGDAQHNVPLLPGDAIFVPDLSEARVFVFGAVKSPGPLPLPAAGMTLMQALAQSGISFVGAKDSRVRILRSLSPTQGQLLVVDTGREMRGESLPFSLQNGDVVYVPTGSLRSWNEAIAELLPSFQAVGAMLQPFVQIKYLSE